MSIIEDLRIEPLTAERWQDFEAVMGPRGGAGGCWCMLWRLQRPAFDAGKGEGHRAAIRNIVGHGDEPGLLAYAGGAPVGWCSVAPRAHFVRLERSRVLKPVDDAPVWSVSCLLVHRKHRGHGVSVALLEAACGFVAQRGGAIVEGYPVEPDKREYPPAYAWTGLASAFRRAGFEEVARRSPTRPIMRKTVVSG